MSWFSIILFITLSALVAPTVWRPATQPHSPNRSGTQQPAGKPGYHLRKILVEGAAIFSTDRVTRIMGLGKRASAETIEQARGKLISAYRNRGRIQAVVDVDRHEAVGPDVQQETYDLVVHISEGPVFVLRRLELIGNDQTRDRVIRHRIVLNEGEPYSEELLEKSLQNINDLVRFEGLSRGDVEIKVDAVERVVDLVIHLKEKPGLKLREK